MAKLFIEVLFQDLTERKRARIRFGRGKFRYVAQVPWAEPSFIATTTRHRSTGSRCGGSLPSKGQTLSIHRCLITPKRTFEQSLALPPTTTTGGATSIGKDSPCDAAGIPPLQRRICEPCHRRPRACTDFQQRV